MDRPLWQPSDAAIQQTNMTRLTAAVGQQWGRSFADYNALHDFSVNEPEKFWITLKDFCGLRAADWGSRVLVDGDKLPGAKWFPDARLNYAENLLRRDDDADALVFRGEDQKQDRVTWRQLNQRVSVMAQAFRAAGLGTGDRIGAYMPNMPETIICMLAAASIGAVWSSCSPDFGVRGVLDRFGQIEPRIIVTVDGYFYNGKSHDTRGRVAEAVAGLPSVEAVIVVPYVAGNPDIGGIRGARLIDDFSKGFAPAEIEYTPLAFDHPLYILYSSGTTGAPKCIVHGAGGALLKLATEQVIHSDIRPGDRVFYFTTCGWMMWNWLAQVLAAEATVLLYDGSPFYPSHAAVFDFLDAEGATLFGTSAKFIDAISKAGAKPMQTHDLSSVRTILSTGSPLAPESFDYVYRDVKSDVQLASIAGGTDICGCFVMGNANLPVRRGEIQCKALGMAVEVFDDDGKSLTGEKGELVCTRTFPSVPLGFLNDQGGRRFHDAYFATYPNVWHHGDYVEIMDSGGIVMFGRSDATLNPGGVRIGTAEIYRQVERLDEVKEGIVIGQQWDYDVRIVLFVVLADGLTLDGTLSDKIKATVRANCTPRHVPAHVLQVADIPRTKSGKITELAVRDVVHGRPVKNQEALANPEALDYFRDRPELRS